MPPDGEHIARLDTQGAGWQREQLHKCIRSCDRLAMLAAGVIIGVLAGWM